MRIWLLGIAAGLLLFVALLGAAGRDLAAQFPRYWAVLLYVLVQLRDMLRIALLACAGGILLLAWVAQRRQARQHSGTLLPFRPRQPQQQRRAA